MIFQNNQGSDSFAAPLLINKPHQIPQLVNSIFFVSYFVFVYSLCTKFGSVILFLSFVFVRSYRTSLDFLILYY